MACSSALVSAPHKERTSWSYVIFTCRSRTETPFWPAAGDVDDTFTLDVSPALDWIVKPGVCSQSAARGLPARSFTL